MGKMLLSLFVIASIAAAMPVAAICQAQRSSITVTLTPALNQAGNLIAQGVNDNTVVCDGYEGPESSPHFLHLISASLPGTDTAGVGENHCDIIKVNDQLGISWSRYVNNGWRCVSRCLRGQEESQACQQTLVKGRNKVIERIQLYQLSASSAPVTAIAESALIGLTDGKQQRKELYSVNVHFNKKRVAQTCTIENHTIDIPLGIYIKNSFTAVGTTTRSIPFQLGLLCDEAELSPTVEFIGDNGAYDASRGIINLQADHVQSGLAIQLLGANGQPIVLNSPLKLAKITAANTLQHYRFYARHIQIQQTVIGGLANGSASFILRYR